jgi:hypothetical protein
MTTRCAGGIPFTLSPASSARAAGQQGGEKMTKTLLIKRIQLMLAVLLVALTVGGGFVLDDASAQKKDRCVELEYPGVCEGP